MNERIKELAAQARRILATDALSGGEFSMKAYEEKFAESIVRECADVIAPMGDWCGGHGEPRMPSTRECAQRLKEYFGVE